MSLQKVDGLASNRMIALTRTWIESYYTLRPFPAHGKLASTACVVEAQFPCDVRPETQ
jgi:hypothetical protein